MRLRCVALALMLGLAGCERSAPAERVSRADHNAFWLWAGISPDPATASRAARIYALAGEVLAASPDRIASRRVAPPRGVKAQLYLTYRLETLDIEPAVVPQMRAELARWRGASDHVAGIQIDFDSGTRGLDRYASFLAELDRALGPGVELSVTGLYDWASQGDPAALRAIGAHVEELVVQTYQGRSTVANADRYGPGLSRVPIPFRVGLVEGGEWREPPGLRINPRFRGYVVFLTR